MKDFLEHLRLVHFTLVITSFSLIVFASIEPEGELKRALNQLAVLLDVKDKLVNGVIGDYLVLAHENSGISCEELDSSFLLDGFDFRGNRGGGGCSFFRTFPVDRSQWSLNLNSKTHFFDIAQDEITADVPIVSLSFLNEIGILDKLQSDVSLSSFSLIWDQLAGVQHLRTIVLGSESVVAYRTRVEDEAAEIGLSTFEYQSLSGVSVTVLPYTQGMTSHCKPWLHYRNYAARSADFDTPLLSLGFSFASPECMEVSESFGIDSNHLISFELGLDFDYSLTELNYLESLLRQLEPELRLERYEIPLFSTTFNKAFPDLVKLSTVLDSTELNQLQEQLLSRLISEEASLPLLGVQIPASALLSWGVLVLLAIQLYFLSHISIFIDKYISNKSTVISFPWIGTYPGVHRLLFFISITILPAYAAFALVGLFEGSIISLLGIDSSPENSTKLQQWFACLVSLVVGVATVYQLRNLTDYRVVSR